MSDNLHSLVIMQTGWWQTRQNTENKRKLQFITFHCTFLCYSAMYMNLFCRNCTLKGHNMYALNSSVCTLNPNPIKDIVTHGAFMKNGYLKLNSLMNNVHFCIGSYWVYLIWYMASLIWSNCTRIKLYCFCMALFSTSKIS